MKKYKWYLLSILVIATTAYAAKSIYTTYDFKAGLETTDAVVKGTAGGGFLELQHQSSDTGTPGSGVNHVRLFGKNKKLYTTTDDGAGNPIVQEVGSGAGSGAGINYVGDYDFEATGNGAQPVDWIADKDGTPGELPTDLTGTPDAAVTFLASTSSPLLGASSAVLTKPDSVDYQGNMWYYPITIDNQFSTSPKLFKIQMYYEASANFDYGDYSTPATDPSDVIVYIVEDPSGAPSMIQPSNFVLDGSGLYEGTFQPSAGQTSYGVMLYVTDDTAVNSWTLKVDNIAVGPQSKVTGPAKSDMVPWTPTFTNAPTTETFGWWRRDGDSVYATVWGDLSGAVTGSILVDLPPGVVLDLNKTVNSNAADSYGQCMGFDGTDSKRYTCTVTYESSSKLRFHYNGSSSPWNATNPITWDASDYIGAEFTIPVLGWSSRTQLSDEGETRVVAAKAYSQTAFAIGTNNSYIKFDATAYDTHGGFTHNAAGVIGGGSGVGTSYIIPVSGKYSFSIGQIVSSTTWVAGNYFLFRIHKNQSIVSRRTKVVWGTGSFTEYDGYSDTIDCNAGDEIQIEMDSDDTDFTTETTGNENAFFEIKRLSGPSAIAASEVVAAKAYGTTAGSIDNAAIYVGFGSIELDTHGGFSGTTNSGSPGGGTIWTCPISGIYSIEAALKLTATSWNATDYYQLEIWVDGVQKSTGIEFIATNNSQQKNPSTSTIVELNAGSVVEVYIYANAGHTAPILATDAGSRQNKFMIKRLGGVMFLIFPVWLLIGRRKKHVLDNFKLAA